MDAFKGLFWFVVIIGGLALIRYSHKRGGAAQTPSFDEIAVRMSRTRVD